MLLYRKGGPMNLADEIRKTELYKTFEAYIDTDDITKRIKGHFTLTGDAPKEAHEALAKWRAIKLSKRF